MCAPLARTLPRAPSLWRPQYSNTHVTGPPITALHVVPSLDQGMGGSVQAALSMCDALRGAGVTSYITSTVSEHDRLAYLALEFPRVETQLFNRRPPRHYYRSPSLHDTLRYSILRADILHVHGVFNFPAAYALSVRRGRSTGIILSPHGQLDPYDLARHRVSKRLYGELFLRKALRRVDCALVTSDMEGASLNTFGVRTPRATIPLPVKAGPQGCGPRLRETYGISSEAPLLLFLGRIDPKKRLDILLASMGRLRHVLTDVALLVVGDGGTRYTRQMHALAASLNIAHKVTWTGNLRGTDKADALDAANLFVLPSENENFGITVVEALLAGLPTLVSDQVHLQTTIAGYGLGGVCRPDVDSCSRSLLDLLSDPARLALCSQRARAVAEALYSPATVGERLRDLYLTVLTRAR